MTTVVLNNKTGVNLLSYEQDKWDLDALRQQTDYNNLSQEKRIKCEECYNQMTPYVISSVLSDSDDEMQGTKIGAYLFINNYDIMAACQFGSGHFCCIINQDGGNGNQKCKSRRKLVK